MFFYVITFLISKILRSLNRNKKGTALSKYNNDELHLSVKSSSAENFLGTLFIDLKSNQTFVSWGEEKPQHPEKNRWSRVENQQTQPTHDADSGNQTRATLHGGRRVLPPLHYPCYNISTHRSKISCVYNAQASQKSNLLRKWLLRCLLWLWRFVWRWRW